MAYLDDTGLAYFWGKIKAWANSVFALLGHTHPASDVTLMTGYSKPASGSAVAVSDTLNQAVGKLEAKVDDALDDSGYVHLTGNEDISDYKTFQNINVRIRDVTKGTVPSSTVYKGLYAQDSVYDADSSDNWTVHRIGAVEFGFGSDNIFSAFLLAYANIYDRNTNGCLAVYYDTNNSTAYATAPSTLATRSEGTDILTRNWIPNDTRIVHTTGDEEISGIKWFHEDIIVNLDIAKGGHTSATADQYRGIYITDNTATFNSYSHDKRFGRVEFAYLRDGSTTAMFGAYKGTNSEASTVFAGFDVNGIAYAMAPVTSASRTDTRDIVTRGWIPNDTRIVHTTGNETVAGEKTFTSGPIIVNNNPSITIKDANGEKGNTNGWALGHWFYDKNDKPLGYISCARYV